MNVESVTYFDSFGIKHIPKEIEKEHSLEIKSITTNIYKIQAFDSIMCGYFCIGFVDFMIKYKKFTTAHRFICF